MLGKSFHPLAVKLYTAVGLRREDPTLSRQAARKHWRDVRRRSTLPRTFVGVRVKCWHNVARLRAAGLTVNEWGTVLP